MKLRVARKVERNLGGHPGRRRRRPHAKRPRYGWRTYEAMRRRLDHFTRRHPSPPVPSP